MVQDGKPVGYVVLLAGVFALLGGVFTLLAGVFALLVGVFALLAGVVALLAMSDIQELSSKPHWQPQLVVVQSGSPPQSGPISLESSLRASSRGSSWKREPPSGMRSIPKSKEEATEGCRAASKRGVKVQRT